MTAYYAALKWPADATLDEQLKTLRSDLPIICAMLVDAGADAEDLVAILEESIDVVEWESCK